MRRIGSGVSILFAVVMTASGLTACGNDCDFTGTRCNGEAVEKCGEEDQIFGRMVTTETCAGLNPHCIQVDPKEAICAIAADKRCTPPAARCEGTANLIECKKGYEVARDCTTVKDFVPGQGLQPANYTCQATSDKTSANCR
jgi:hypothetical protein